MSARFNSIVVLTGAGVSAESGIKTFRDSGGLWENHRLEDVCTPEGFAKNPALVHQFYNARRAQLKRVSANAAHSALAEFERQFSGDFTLVTQNVDDLHERAGSRNVLHMHGELLKVRCLDCRKSLSWHEDTHSDSLCPRCNTSGQLRPDIVWFGEIPKCMPQIEHALSSCDLFVAIGTSGNVYPAAGFVALAQSLGAHTAELNLEPSAGRSAFDEYHLGPASQAVPDYFAQLVC